MVYTVLEKIINNLIEGQEDNYMEARKQQQELPENVSDNMMNINVIQKILDCNY